MAEFYEGTLDTMIKRLCDTIYSFDKGWVKQCVPAKEKQIRQLEDICAQYQYVLPSAYLAYLWTMGQNDGGLLEREWDGHCEPDIDTILELFADEDFYAKEELEKGLLLFSYHWTEANSYLRLSDWNDNPVVIDCQGEYFAGSFEKYLFQKAFRMYHEKFKYEKNVGSSINSSEAVLKKYAFPHSMHGGTVEERMHFARQLVEPFPLKETWFSDNVHYFSYDERYALTIDIRHVFLITFSCNDPVLKEQAEIALNRTFYLPERLF